MVMFIDGNVHSFIHKIVIVALTCGPTLWWTVQVSRPLHLV